MKIAYLILAHNNPCHLRRLISALASPASVCFIHIDKKSTIDDFLSIAGENVVLSDKRVAIDWGDFSMVEATLVLIHQALADLRHFDRLVLLSGTDYPLRSVTAIENFFSDHPTAEFINLVQMPAEAERKPLNRLTDYSLRPQDPYVMKFGMKLLSKLTYKLSRRPISRYRAYKRTLGHFVPYAGDQWWALSRAACQYIQMFVEKEHNIVNFFKHTHCPDEMFFQIILGNSVFKSNIRRNVTYVDWRVVGYHPAWISEDHLDQLFEANLSFKADEWYGAGPMLFARKFSDTRESVVDALAKRIMKRETAPNNQQHEEAAWAS